MALVTSTAEGREPSGVFRNVTVWSCPTHNEPSEEHYCDCEFCTAPSYACAGCEAASWVPKLDENGEVVKVELTKDEVAYGKFFAAMIRDSVGASLRFTEMLRLPTKDGPKIAWMEDEA